MAENNDLNVLDDKNTIKSCTILREDQIHGRGYLINPEGVRDVRRKVHVRDDNIEDYHLELTRLWQSVHNHILKKRTEAERDDSDYDEGEDDENHELEVGRHKKNLQKINEAIKSAATAVKSGMSRLRKEHQSAVFCPLAESFWHHPNYPSLPLTFQNMKVKLCHGSKIVPFHEGAEEYVKMYFEKEKTYRIPVSSKMEQKQEISKDDKRQLTHIPDEEIPETHQSVISDRKGEVANDSVARCFEKWGIEYKQNMMIFTDLRLPNQKFHCPANFVCTNGDFDVLILSDEFVLFCQVKGVDEGTQRSTKLSTLQKAWKQSIKDRRHFCEVTRDLSFISSVPMHRVIAVPNLTSDILKELGVCSYHRRFTLCKSDMTPFSRFVRWMSDIVNSKGNVAHVSTPSPQERYRTLCARFVGVVSKVRLNTDEVLIQATDNVINPKHYVKKVNLNQQCRLYAILTPEQTKLIQDDRRKLKIIIGEFGTGKSLVLLAKVLNLLQDKENPSLPLMISLASIGNDGHCYHKTNFHAVNHLKEILDLPAEKENSVVLSISDLIKDYCSAISKPRDEVRTLVTPELFYGMLSWKVRTTERVVHFFFDEVPLSFVQKCESVFRDFPTNFPGNRIWLAIAAHSSKPTQIFYEDYQATINRLAGTISSDPPLTGDSYVVERLNRSMRVPRNVYSFVRFMQENEYPDLSKSVCGHVVAGPKPLFFEVPKCKCQYAKARSEDILKCHCSVQRLSITLERVMSKCHLIDSGTPVDPSNCNILINVLLGSKLTKPLIMLLKGACDILKVRLSYNLVVLLDEQSQAAQDGEDGEGLTLNVFDQYTFMGCENAVIIGIDPYSLFQCGEKNHWTHSMNVFTRTTSLYIHIFWPKEDARKMWHADLDAHDVLTRSREYLTEDEKYARFEFTARGRASRGDLVEKLIQTDCVINMPVLTDENSSRISNSIQSTDLLQ